MRLTEKKVLRFLENYVGFALAYFVLGFIFQWPYIGTVLLSTFAVTLIVVAIVEYLGRHPSPDQ